MTPDPIRGEADGVEVVIEVGSLDARRAFAFALGELIADLYLDGKLDLD